MTKSDLFIYESLGTPSFGMDEYLFNSIEKVIGTDKIDNYKHIFPSQTDGVIDWLSKYNESPSALMYITDTAKYDAFIKSGLNTLNKIKYAYTKQKTLTYI